MAFNAQILMEQKIKSIENSGRIPSLLLQCCCAPCSSYVLEYLSRYFDITCYYYNPNIEPEEEYVMRAEELKRFIAEHPHARNVGFIRGEYENDLYHELIAGLEDEPERGERCTKCYGLRLDKTAEYAAEHGYDLFTTTLSISPHKDADRLNRLGKAAGEQYGVEYLYADFKKKGGYQRSIQLSKEYGLYRQDYCGCLYSKRR